ncbi:MAG: MlaD family protein, partial [Thermoguttaceae bacterium]
MNERIMQFRVGVMILATILIAAILVLLFMGTSPLLHGTYTIYIKFNDAPGVTRDTPVRKAGIRIGRVSNVQFADDDTGVIVTAEIDRDRRLYSNEQCKATNSLLMGDATLEFVRTANFPGEKVPIENGAVLQGQMAPDMTGSIAGMQRQAAQTLDTLNTAGRDIDKLATRVDRLVEMNEERITRMIAEADETMKLLQKALIASNDILGDPKLREQIKQTISEMPAVLKETRGAVEQIGGTFASLERNMQNIEGLTKPLGERGPSLVEEFDTSMKKLNHLSDN